VKISDAQRVILIVMLLLLAPVPLSSQISARYRSEPTTPNPEAPPGFVTEWGKYGRDKGNFDGSPILLDLDQHGNVYAADEDGIQSFDLTGRLIAAWPSRAIDFAIGELGFIYAIEQELRADAVPIYRVVTHNANGAEVDTDNFSFTAIESDQDGHLYAQDPDRIVRLDRSFRISAEYRIPRRLRGGLLHYLGMTAGPRGVVLILMSGGRVLKWEVPGEDPKLLDIRGAAEEARYSGIAATPDGGFLVSDWSGGITKFNSEGHRLASWGGRGVAPGEFGDHATSMVVSRGGDVYAADPGNYRIQKFSPGHNTPAAREAWSGVPRILLHLTAPTRKNLCYPSMPQHCSDFVTAGDFAPEGRNYSAYVLVDKGTLRALDTVRFGITYGNGGAGAMNDGHGIDVLEWKSCGDLNKVSHHEKVAPGAPHDECLRVRQPAPMVSTGWNSWPEPCSYIEVAWMPEHVDRMKSLVVVGYFVVTVFSPDTLRITIDPRNESGASEQRRGGSRSVAIDPASIGWAVFSKDGIDAGFNPCGAQ
jgi:hypothetical protein